MELVEAGRAVLWAQWLATRSDLSAVTAASPELATRLRESREIIDGAPTTVTGERPPGDRRMAAAQQWESAVAEGCRLPGLSGFLRLPSFEHLRDRLPDGTTVIITVSRRRCDALLVTPAGVRAVRLPKLTFDEAYDRTNDLVCAHESADGGGEPAAYDAAITGMLTWLWTAVAAPVRAEIRSGPGHRVWWCPTGPLTLLPLHTATSPDGRESAMDRVVSSYTPTVRALAESDGPESRVPADSILAVIQRDTPGMVQLSNAVRERDTLRELTGGQLTELDGNRATRAAATAQGRNALQALTDLAAGHLWLPSVEPST